MSASWVSQVWDLCVPFSLICAVTHLDQCCYLHFTERKIANPSPEVPSQGHDRQAGIALKFPTRACTRPSPVTVDCLLKTLLLGRIYEAYKGGPVFAGNIWASGISL